jgi:hypothetical protein
MRAALRLYVSKCLVQLAVSSLEVGTVGVLADVANKQAV